MESLGQHLGNVWPFLVALFCSATAFMLVWDQLERSRATVTTELTWLATTLGVGLILVWLFFLVDFGAWLIVVLAFVVGGLPAIARGGYRVIRYMVDAEELVADDETTNTR